MLNNNNSNHNNNNNNNHNYNSSNGDTTQSRRLVTDPLDDAMRELLDICQQYNDKFAMKRQPRINVNNCINQSSPSPSSTFTMRHQSDYHSNDTDRNTIDSNITQSNSDELLETFNCDTQTDRHYKNVNCLNRGMNKHQHEHSIEQSMQTHNSINYNSMKPINEAHPPTSLMSSLSTSVEHLQNKQTELQLQLDDVTKVARELELKQKRKLKSILEDSDVARNNHYELDELQEDDDEDAELIEFQQIENELRISDLNRQLSNIQEELRLRLYKRLLSNTTNGAKTSHMQQSQRQQNQSQNPLRRNSADDSSPPSSSCSDEQTATPTSTCTVTESTSSQAFTGPATGDSEITKHKQQITERLASPRSMDSASTEYNYIDQKTSNVHEDYNHQMTTNQLPIKVHQHQDKSEKNVEVSQHITVEPEILQSVSKEEVDGNLETNTSNLPQDDLARDMVKNNSNKMNNNNNMQLERIEEDEEDDDEDFYNNSDRLRTIYQEKLSPIIKASAIEDNRTYNHTICQDNGKYPSNTKAGPSTPDRHDNEGGGGFSNPGFDSSNVNSASRSNRPLTLYLPKPDEDIDLMEHIQALGHDLNIISKDLTLTPASAHGYLYKSCSSNSKKWLKRYFYFDRSSKILAYYENSSQLVKKRNSTPRNVIPFDEIGDVYVEHRLSALSDKEGTSKKNFVFILSTIKRKYMLASSNAETMRAWIDILFTAAKANDYFQQLDNSMVDNESYDFQNY